MNCEIGSSLGARASHVLAQVVHPLRFCFSIIAIATLSSSQAASADAVDCSTTICFSGSVTEYFVTVNQDGTPTLEPNGFGTSVNINGAVPVLLSITAATSSTPEYWGTSSTWPSWEVPVSGVVAFQTLYDNVLHDTVQENFNTIVNQFEFAGPTQQSIGLGGKSFDIPDTDISFTVGGSVTLLYQVTIPSGANVILNQPGVSLYSLNIASSAASLTTIADGLSVSHSFDNYGSFSISAGTSVSAGASLDNFGFLNVAGNLTVAQTLNNEGGAVFVTSGGLLKADSLNNTASGLVSISNGGTVELSSVLHNSGLIALTSTGDTTHLSIPSGDVLTLTGGGLITMSDNPNNAIVGNDGFWANIPFVYTPTLNNVDNTISGAGTIGVTGYGRGQEHLHIINSGIIDANSPNNPLFLNPDSASSNSGIFEATGGGTLELGSIILDNTGGAIRAFSGSTVRNYGTINNGTLEALTGGTLDLQGGALNSAIIQVANGATLNIASQINSSTINGVSGSVITAAGGTLNSDTFGAGTTIQINNGQTLTMNGATVNPGLIALNSTGALTQLMVSLGNTLTLTGGGAVRLSDNASNWIGASNSDFRFTTQLINQDNTIEGSGVVGANNLAIINHGMIDANGSNPLYLGSTKNDGVMQASNGGMLELNQTDNSNGIIQALNGSTVDFIGSNLVNRNGAILTGGTYNVVSTGALTTLNLESPIVTNQANVQLSGANAQLVGFSTLADNQGHFTISNGQSFGTAGNLSNSGAVDIQDGSTILHVAGEYNQIGGSTLIHGGTLQIDGGATVTGGLLGGTGTIIGTLTVDGGTVQIGASPDALNISGNYEQTGGKLTFEIDPNGLGYLESTFVLTPGNLVLIKDSDIVFEFKNGADPLSFFNANQFDIDTFFKSSNGSPFSYAFDLTSIFQGDQFEFTGPHAGTLNFAPETGALDFAVVASVPEPSTWAMFICGLSGAGIILRRKRASRERPHNRS